MTFGVDGSDRKTNVTMSDSFVLSDSENPYERIFKEKILKKKNFGTTILHDCPNLATNGWASLEVISIELIQNVTSLFVHNAKMVLGFEASSDLALYHFDRKL